MPDFYMLAIAIICIVAIIFWGKRRKNGENVKLSDFISLPEFEKIRKYEWIIVGVLLAIGIFVRLYLLGSLPGGINQDEASISYDTFAIAKYGIDRNGYVFPVYPVAWGAGHAPLMTYISMPFISLFGLNALSFRLANAILGILSLLFIYLLVKRLHNVETGMLALLLLVVNPWHIMMSRWALDANCLPAVFLCGVWLFSLAIDKQSSKFFYLAAGVLALSLYAYGTVYIVIPIFLLIVCIYLLKYKKIKLKTLFISAGVFLVIALPIILFLAINFLNLKPIITPFFSIPKLTALRSGSTFISFNNDIMQNIWYNIYDMLKLVLFQGNDLPWNSISQFGTMYLYAPPLILIGALLLFAQNIKKGFRLNITIFAWFIGALVLSFVLLNNVNRINIIFIPIIYLIVLAICFIVHNFKYALPLILVIIIANFAYFTTFYFIKYPSEINPLFYQSFGDAIKDAEKKTNGDIYIPAQVNGAYVETLFYATPSPKEFLDTVKYINPYDEFRQASDFGRFHFFEPSNIDKGSVYVVDNSNVDKYTLHGFKIDSFKYYSVAYK
jgi:4-amino-4-deoxy-L-arabinose transferase-like glycosyltransferase